MRRLLLLAPLLGGCPPPTHYLITDVTAYRAPVADALVAADCGALYTDAAARTGVDGRATLSFRRRVDARTCSIRVAKEGLPTVEAAPVSICTTPSCPATHVELGEIAQVEVEPLSEIPLELPQEYAQPPRRSMEVAQ